MSPVVKHGYGHFCHRAALTEERKEAPLSLGIRPPTALRLCGGVCLRYPAPEGGMLLSAACPVKL